MQARKNFCYLILFHCVLTLIIVFWGRELLALMISVVCAYLLNKPFVNLMRLGLSKTLSASIVVLLFFVAIVLLLLVVFPPMVTEAYSFLSSIPKILSDKQPEIAGIINNISAKVPSSTVRDFTEMAKHYLSDKSTTGLLFLVNLLPVTFEVLLYFILVPIIIFFLLRDGNVFISYISSLMPNIAIATKFFWSRLNLRLGSYLQGKLFEILIVFLISLLLYGFFGLKYTLLMSGLMGLSVLVPIFGAILVTLPIVLIAFWQFGYSDQALYLIIGHGLILAIDANLIVPLLFAEKLALHPLVILVGILFFGAILGFWGLFFAIPILIVLSILLDNFKYAFVKECGIES